MADSALRSCCATHNLHEADYIRRARCVQQAAAICRMQVKVLRCVQPISIDDVVLGQYSQYLTLVPVQ